MQAFFAEIAIPPFHSTIPFQSSDCILPDQGYEVSIVFFDISKALDTVPHLSLLETLQDLNVNVYLPTSQISIRWC